MKIIKTISEMQEWSDAERGAGRSVGCVPTMGYLHEGHLSLIEECARLTDKVVMTLFVNPTQFSPEEDLSQYPRDFDGDLEKAGGAGAHVVFFPSANEMYQEGYQTYVTVEDVSADMEGVSRPVHFRGVATVVTKLFQAVRPRVAIFGEKDFQQLKVIERMVRDLNMGVRIVGMPTVRDPDGIAMSSRNTYLSGEERERALSISRALFAARKAVEKGERGVGVLVEAATKTITEAGLDIDYVRVRDTETLKPIENIERPARMLIAARAGKTRLIDNIGLGS